MTELVNAQIFRVYTGEKCHIYLTVDVHGMSQCLDMTPGDVLPESAVLGRRVARLCGRVDKMVL